MEISCSRLIRSAALICLWVILFGSGNAGAQLTVTASNNASQLASTLTGPGVVVTNVTMNCPNGAAGTFDGTNSNLGLGRGVLLTSGSVNNAPGPNNAGNAGTINNTAGDNDLTRITLPFFTRDACVLEFDLTPFCDTIQISYVFASEEYDEFVCDAFNDVFAFFISGPGIVGTQNIALIPGTATPVAINTVNGGVLGTNGTNGPGCILTNTTFFRRNTQNSIQYDGMTNTLLATAAVVPCSTYHIKLAIADANDPRFDSGVFLEAGGIRCATDIATVEEGLSIPTAFNGVEGCIDGVFNFIRFGDNSQALTLNYSVTGTATSGVDYVPLPGSITIPANSNNAFLTVPVIADGITEGLESISIILSDTVCGTILRDTATIFIQDQQTVEAGPPVSLCSGDTIQIGPVSTPGDTFEWVPTTGLDDPRSSNPNLTLSTPGSYTYFLSKTDSNGCRVIDSLQVTVSQPPTSSFTATSPVCQNDSATILYTGSAGAGATYTWNFDGGNGTGSGQGPYRIAWPSTGNKQLSLSVDDGCPSAQTQVLVRVSSSFSISVSGQNPSCAGDSNGLATVSISGGTPPFSISWNTLPVQTTDTAFNLGPGTWVVTVTDSNGCSDTASVILAAPPALRSIAQAVNVPCNGGNSGLGIVTAFGGLSSYTYLWNTTPVQTGDTASGLAAGTYSVIVSDSNGCTDTASITLTEPGPLGLSLSASPVSCPGNNDGYILATASGGNGNYAYQWSSGSSTDSTGGLAPGTYFLTLTDSSFTNFARPVVFWEDFEGPSGWNLNISTGTNGADHNFWVINDNEGGILPPACGVAGNGNNTLHITSVFCPTCGAAYDAGGFCGTLFCPETNMRAEGPAFSTLGYSNLQLEFDFIANGDSLNDNASVWYNAGTGWNQLAATIKSPTCLGGQGQWTRASFTLPASCNNNPNVRIGFVWTNNDDGIGTDPSVALNNVLVTAPPPAPDTAFCTLVDTATLAAPNPVSITFNSQAPLCNGDSSGWIKANVSGGNGRYTYQWSNGASTDSIFGLPGGTYTLTLLDTAVTGAGGGTVQPLYTEDFDGPVNWTLNVSTGTNGANNNFWLVDDTEGGVAPPGCGVANNGDSTLHITSVFCSTCGAAYDAGGLCGILFCPETNRRAESPTISTVGFTNLNLSFDFIANGQGLLDNASLLYNDGTGWTVLAASLKSTLCVNSQGRWTAANFPLPASCNNIPNLRIGFNWTNNDDGVGTDPSVAINNIVITGLSSGSGSGSVVCTYTDSVSLVEPTALNLNPSGSNISCNGYLDGTASVAVSGGTPAYQVAWNTTPIQIGDTATGLGPGTYVVVVQDSNGCLDSSSINLTQPAVLSNSFTVAGIDCHGDSSGSILANPGGGNGNFSLNWNTGSNAATLSNLPAGTYIVTITDTGAGSTPPCSLIDTVMLSQAPALNLSISSSGSPCGGSSGSATVTASGGSPGYAFVWNNGATVNAISNLIPGNYTVTVTDSLGCTDSISTTIVAGSGPILNPDTIIPPACFGQATGSATVSASGGQGTLTLNWNTIPPQSGNTATGLTAGTYTVIASDTAGCGDTLTITVPQPALLQVSLSSTGSLCGQSNATITATASGGTASYSYLWNNGSTLPSLQNAGPGTYTVTVTDSLGCTVSDSVTILSSPTIQLQLQSITNASCPGSADGSAAVQASGGIPPFFYQWSNGQTGPAASFLSQGTYSVTVTDSLGCTDTLSILITEPAPIVTFMTSTPVSCNAGQNPNGTATVNAVGGAAGYSYIWNTIPPQTSSTATGLSSGFYSVTVTDINGCSTQNSVFVGIQASPMVTAGGNVSFCEGESGAQLFASASGGAPGYAYTWWCDTTNTFCGLDSINDNDPNALPTVSTTYYVQVTDANGCVSNVDSLFVTVIPKPIVDAGRDITICGDSAPCVNLNATVLNSSGPFRYQWLPSTGLSNDTIPNPCARPDTTTIYTIVVTDLGTGCTSELTTLDTLATITVNVNNIPVAEAGPDRDVCLGDSIRLTGFGSGAGPFYTYQWSPQSGLSNPNVQNPVASPPITTSYYLTVWSNGCPSYADSVTVSVHTVPTLFPGPDRDACRGEQLQLDAVIGGDSSASYTYQWIPASGLSNATVENPLASPDSTTTYTVIGTSNWGCDADTANVTVFLKPSPIAEAGPILEMCQGDTIQLQGSYSFGTTPTAPPSQVYFSWTPNQDINDTTLLTPLVSPPGSRYYTLSVRHNTCSDLDSVLVTVYPAIPVTLTADTTVACQGDSIQLFASGGNQPSYTWVPAAGLSDPGIANPKAAPDSSTTYTVILQEARCTGRDSIALTIIPRPEAAYLSSLPTGCVPHTVHFLQTSTNSIFHIWDFGDGSPVSNEPNPVHTYTQPGTYLVSLSSVNTGGCLDSVDTLRIQVSDTATADFISDPDPPAVLMLPNRTVSFFDRSVNATNWNWDFGDGAQSSVADPVHQYQQTGTYTVTLQITNEDGCQSIVSKGPYVIQAPGLSIPNVFSPNGDGSNDFYRVDYSGSQPFLIKVYDRWGALLYESRDKYQGWNGRNQNGDAVPEGVYFFLIRVGQQEYTGELTLMR